jgi:hypothetical protein
VEQATALNKQLLLTAVAVSIDELTPEQLKRLQLIAGQIVDGVEPGSADDPYKWFHQELKGIAANAMSAAHEAVMKLTCAIDYEATP